jgi:uncharacterized iron-regulated protein
MKIIYLFLVSTLINAYSFSQDIPAYAIYSSTGKKTSFKKLVDQSKNADCILFGEYHDNPIVHWLQFELSNEIASTNLVLGFEMFESDQQQVLDGYLSGKLNEKQFQDSCRLWPNYETDVKLFKLLKKTR